ncbi:hypothetical protein EDD18DRAFT_1097831 [Armillaria luteobubalina]|uniref:Uncharacterized protein n=1 Tax=Armillaria luteobubalina TaxID=153913 RepID=A0AA39V5J3_9AGAR|nr:hypothetical protein EDD18DRAFT_1097831 [Armillaria luteobubalina]
MSVPHLSDQDYYRCQVANAEQPKLGKSTRSRQLEVHHVHFDTSVLIRTEEWSDASLVGQSNQFQPLKGDEGEDFSANSMYDQLEHDPMWLSQAPWNTVLQAQSEGLSNVLTQELVLTPCSPSPSSSKPDWYHILRQLQSFADHHRIITASWLGKGFGLFNDTTTSPNNLQSIFTNAPQYSRKLDLGIHP